MSWHVTFTQVGTSEGRYSRPIYEARILNCDLIGTVEWHGVFGWRFVPGRYPYQMNIEILTKIVDFMKTLPLYRSGKSIGTTKSLNL